MPVHSFTPHPSGTDQVLAWNFFSSLQPELREKCTMHACALFPHPQLSLPFRVMHLTMCAGVPPQEYEQE